MNDNRNRYGGADFTIGREEFDFYAFLPDFKLVEVYERRLERGKGRWIAVQDAATEGYVCVTAYCFSRF